MLKRYLLIPTIWILILVFWALPAVAEMIVDTAWVRSYNGPGNYTDCALAIAIHDSGNVYVTGYSDGTGTDEDYATIKYYPNGDTAWTARYNGPGNGIDQACAISVDRFGNVYVTGVSDQDSTSYDNPDYATIKYYLNGDTAWIRRHNGPGNYTDYANALAVDDSGYVYVTGFDYTATGTYWDYCTIKYHPNGDTAWVRRYDGPGNSGDYAYAMAIDDSGNVYVTGISDDDYATVKYSRIGETTWVRRYNGPGGYGDRAYDVAVDGSGNVYVTGKSSGSGTSSDYATIKYYPNGDTAWVRRYDGPGNESDEAEAIEVDSSGNVYVTGWSDDSTGVFWDYATIKYHANGDTAWVRRYDGPINNSDHARDLSIDVFGNTYVTGYSWGSSGTEDYTTIKYTPEGDIVWVERYPRGGAQAVAVDDSGYVYVTGGAWGGETRSDYITIKYFQALRGDVNGDGIINLADIIFLINYLYRGDSPPDPPAVGDCNCDGVVDLGDVVFLINYLFKGGAPPDC